jgi:DEAD/DEAH box helicase domain-containing protein
MGLSATNAMELGIDIGQLDAVLINGYPGSISSFWQQAGRAGRGERDGLAIYVAHDDPLDQFLIRDPEILLRGNVESAVVNPENRNVLSRHLECAAFEMPLTVTDMNRFGSSALELAEALDRQGRITFRNGAFYSTASTNPAGDVNIRTSDGEVVRLLCNGEEIGSMEKWRALRAAHEGAVYLHRGQTYLVQHLDLKTLTAVIQTTEVPYYTQAVVESIVLPTGAIAQKGTWSLENVSVTTTVIGYRRRMIEGDQTLDIVDLDLPPQQFETIGVRLNMLERTPDTNPVEFLGAVHAAEHALLAVAPILAGCDRNDLGSSWTAAMPDTYLPGIVVYDSVPGGVGLAEKLYQERASWQRLARQLLASCECDDGCPACLLSFRCESGNEPLNKSGAIALL